MAIEQRYARQLGEVQSVCEQAGREMHEVCLVAVSKTVGASQVEQAFSAGARNFGENRPEGLLEKAPLFPGANWHFIGNIQSRRIPEIVAHAALVHSLHDERHALKIDAAAHKLDKVQEVLLEVNVSQEVSKSGLAPSQVPDMLKACQELSHVRVRGLMTMAPQGDPARAREVFDCLASLKDELRHTLPPEKALYFDGLSMGMSEDWREAVHAGATIVRIGRAVFDDAFDAK